MKTKKKAWKDEKINGRKEERKDKRKNNEKRWKINGKKKIRIDQLILNYKSKRVSSWIKKIPINLSTEIRNKTLMKNSGSGDTSCSVGPFPSTFLYSKSPSALDTAREPFTRYTIRRCQHDTRRRLNLYNITGSVLWPHISTNLNLRHKYNKIKFIWLHIWSSKQFLLFFQSEEFRLMKFTLVRQKEENCRHLFMASTTFKTKKK